MTYQARETFKKVNAALDRFQAGEGRSRVVTRNLGGGHYAVEIIGGTEGSRQPNGRAPEVLRPSTFREGSRPNSHP